MKAKSGISENYILKEANLHRLAYAGIPGEDDTIVESDFMQQLVIVRANEQHIRTKFVVEEETLSISGIMSVHHGILTDALFSQRTQGLTDLSQLFVLFQLELFKNRRLDDGQTQG